MITVARNRQAHVADDNVTIGKVHQSASGRNTPHLFHAPNHPFRRTADA
jgi:hypothetical protein